MRGTKFIETATVTGGTSFSIKMPPGRYLGVLMRLRGTTDTAQTLALVDIGTIRVERLGSQVIGRSAEFFYDYTERFGGFPAAPTGNAATAEDVCWIVPFMAYGIPNSMEVLTQSELVLYMDPLSTLATRFGANPISLDVIGITDDEIPESYQLRIISQDFVTTAASQIIRERLLAQNIVQVCFDDTGADISTIQLEVDDKIVAQRMDDTIYTFLNDIYLRTEAAGNPLTVLPTAGGGDLGSYVNQNAILEITAAAAGTIPITVVFAEKSPQERAKTSWARVQSLKARNQGQAQRAFEQVFGGR